MAPNTTDEAVSRVLRCYAERKDGHHKFCQGVQANYRAFRGLMDEVQERDKPWNHRISQPHIAPTIEGIVANLVDDRTRFRVRPRPRMASPQEIQRAVDGARALELLLNYQLDVDRFHEKQRTFVLQNCIAGVTAAKVYWKTELGTRYETAGYDTRDEYGLPKRGYADLEYEDVIFDGPCFENILIEDLIWPEAATKLDLSDCEWIIHRTPALFDDLKELERQGVYKDVDKINSDEMDSYSDEYARVQEELSGDKRFKNRVELMEYWSKDRLIVVANRKVKIRDEPNPFQHGRFPFVVCSTTPDLFRIPGLSIVDKVKETQKQIWSLENQILDNVELATNMVFAVRDDLIDTDELEFYPGAIWSVPGNVNDSVMQFRPDGSVVTSALEALGRYKADLQNVTGGMPFLAGANSQELDQKTATGVSIVTSIAQRTVMALKQQLAWAYERVADMFIANSRQFLRDPVLLQIIGPDGFEAYQQIEPDSIHGFDYHVQVEAASESLMRQERRAEAQALLQVASQTAAVFAAIQQGAMQRGDFSKKIPNLEALYEDLLRSYDKDNIERYFSIATPPPQQMPAPGMPGLAPGPPGGGGSPMGVTAPQAYDASSPSSSVSLSPEVFAQRALAMSGRQQ